jgi:hypothetical protein
MVRGRAPRSVEERTISCPHCQTITVPWRRLTMGRYMLLWLLGVPIPILLLLWAFGGLN